MLPFGSITSIIPLFVLAFAYMLYFGASALNRLKPDDNTVISESKDIIFNKQPDQDHHLLYFFPNEVISQDIITEEETAVHFPDHFISFIRIIPDEESIPQFSGSGLFCRPPPIIS
jgi:hypothetical protein